jgi:CPA2 family monovalent cation:H+ antiporter-2
MGSSHWRATRHFPFHWVEAGVGFFLGWPLPQGIVVGCIVAVASTMGLMRLLMDRGELSSGPGRIMITLTLVEDLAVVILTVLPSSLGSSDGAKYSQVLWKIGKAFLLLIPIVFAGWKIIPRLLTRVQKICNDEIFLLSLLGACDVVHMST